MKFTNLFKLFNMSRIGKQPVIIPSGVTVEIKENTVTVKGPKGELKQTFHPTLTITMEDNKIIVARKGNEKQAKALHGLTRNLLVNMVEGVTKGYEKKMEIIGVGFKAQVNKNKITLSLGFSHPVEYTAPAGTEFKLNEENKGIVTITNIDKQIIGEVAAKLRSFKKPEPYKGKGIRYLGERIVKKAGKAAATAGAAGAK